MVLCLSIVSHKTLVKGGTHHTAHCLSNLRQRGIHSSSKRQRMLFVLLTSVSSVPHGGAPFHTGARGTHPVPSVEVGPELYIWLHSSKEDAPSPPTPALLSSFCHGTVCVSL